MGWNILRLRGCSMASKSWLPVYCLFKVVELRVTRPGVSLDQCLPTSVIQRHGLNLSHIQVYKAFSQSRLLWVYLERVMSRV